MGTVPEGDGDGWDVGIEHLHAPSYKYEYHVFKELGNKYQMNQYELIQLVDRLSAVCRLLFP